MPSKPRNLHDHFFRALLSSADVTLALLRLALPSAALDGVAPRDLRLGDSAISDGRRLRHPDRLASIGLPERRRLLALIEHQTRPDRDMGLRLLDEAVTLCRRPRRRATPRTRPLPLVVSVVVYQGREPWSDPVDLGQRFGLAGPRQAALAPFLPGLRYGLIDLHRRSDNELSGLPALRLGLLLLKHAATRDPWPVLLDAGQDVRAVFEEGGRDALWRYLDYAARTARGDPPRDFLRQLALAAGYAPREVFMSYAQRLVRQGRREGRQEGRLEGRQEGEASGQRRLLRRLLERRFGALSSAAVDAIEAADAAQLLTWTDDLLVCDSAEALLGLAPAP